MPALHKMMKLINCMSSGIKYTREELQEKMGISRSTFFNYISTLRDSGFCVKCSDGRYQMLHIDRSLKEFSQLVHFSDEEAYLINMAIDSIHPTNMLKANVKNKLMAVYDVASLQDYTICRNCAERIDNLTKAIHNREAVVLKDYCSSNSDTVRDRLVEPFAFTTDCRNLFAYDLESGTVKCFSPARMGDVQLTSQAWKNEDSHRIPKTDIFDMTGDRESHVRILLDARARNLLEEEYPKSVKYISQVKKNSWMLDTYVCKLEGIARFVMGLPLHTVICEGEDLKRYISKVTKASKELAEEKDTHE